MGNRKHLSGASKVHNTKEQPGGLELPPSAWSSEGLTPEALSVAPTGPAVAKVNNSWAPGNGKCLRRSLNRWAALGEIWDPTGETGC